MKDMNLQRAVWDHVVASREREVEASRKLDIQMDNEEDAPAVNAVYYAAYDEWVSASKANRDAEEAWTEFKAIF